MNLDNLPFRVYGDQSFRGKCPVEALEQITFFRRVRDAYPDSYGLIAFHPRNEGLKSGGQFSSVSKIKAEGATRGVPDIVIPGSRTLMIELKRRDRTVCAWQEGQYECLLAAHNAGAFVCVALGCNAAWEAFNEWLKVQ